MLRSVRTKNCQNLPDSCGLLARWRAWDRQGSAVCTVPVSNFGMLCGSFVEKCGSCRHSTLCVKGKAGLQPWPAREHHKLGVLHPQGCTSPLKRASNVTLGPMMSRVQTLCNKSNRHSEPAMFLVISAALSTGLEVPEWRFSLRMQAQAGSCPFNWQAAGLLKR